MIVTLITTDCERHSHLFLNINIAILHSRSCFFVSITDKVIYLKVRFTTEKKVKESLTS